MANSLICDVAASRIATDARRKSNGRPAGRLVYVGLTRERRAGGEWAPPPADPQRRRRSHVEEQRRRTAASRPLALALFGNLTRLLTILAADSEGQRAKALLGDFLAALEAVAVVALLEADQGVVDLVERLGLHLDERELDVVLDVRFGALDGVEHFLLAAPGAFRPDVAHLAFDFSLNLAATLLEHSLQFAVSGLRRCLGHHRRCLLHKAAPQL